MQQISAENVFKKDTTRWGRLFAKNCERIWIWLYNPVLGNEIPNLIWDLEMQTDHLLSVRRQDLAIVNHIYPTPPLGQDMTQGQFLSRV